MVISHPSRLQTLYFPNSHHSKIEGQIEFRKIRETMLGCFKKSKNNYEPISSPNVPRPHPIGVVRVVVQAANIRKRLLKPRPFVLIRVQGRSETKTTSTVKIKTHSPNWFSESACILIVYSLQENIEFEILNHHRFIKDGTIGHSTFSLARLKDEARRVGEESSIVGKDNEINGTTLFDIFYYPVSSSREVTSTSPTGVVTLHIQRARNFQWENYRTKPRKLFVVTSLGWGDRPLHKTEASYQSDLPVWNSSFNFVCYEKTSAVIVMKIVEKSTQTIL